MASEESAPPPRRSLLNTAVIYVVSNMLGAAIPFVLMPVLTRRLTPEDYGITAMFATTVSVFGCFAGLSVHGAVSLRYFQREGFDLRRYVGTALGVLAASTALVFAIALIALRPLSNWVGLPPAWLLAAVVVASANFVSQTRLALWQAETRALSYLAFQVSSSLVNFLSSIALVVIANLHYVGRLAATGATTLLFAAIAFMSLLRSKQLTFAFDRAAAVDAVRFGVPLIPHTLGALVITLADRFLITKYVGINHTGIYIVGAQIGMIIGILADAFNRAYAPWLFAELSKESGVDRRRIVKLTYGYFVGITALALGLALIAPAFLSVFVGRSFQGSAAYVVWLALAGAFQGMYMMVTNYIFFAKRTELLASVTFGAGVANIALNYWLIRRNGAIGAAQATCIAYFLSFVGSWIVSARVYPMNWSGRESGQP